MVKGLFERKGSAILCQYITQGDFPSSLYPESTNTIRIVCARKKGESECRVVAAVQRIGCNASKPVDNVSSGGMTSEIDLKTGHMSEAFAIHGEEKNVMVPLERHPDTGAQIKGRVIPNWETLCKDIEQLTNSVPYLNFVAWDILLTSAGFTIIEGNASSGCRIYQMKHGIRNDALGEILKSYGIIK